MRKRRADGEPFGISFLDTICCGFGAIALLLLISKPTPVADEPEPRPAALARETSDAAERVGRLRTQWQALHASPAEAASAEEEAARRRAVEERLRSASERLARIRDDNRGLELVADSLRRASIRAPAPAEERQPEVGGIPVDSEHVVFILDTSGSMKTIWDRVMDTIANVLDIHPTVRGFQVLNDNGVHLIDAYRKKWIPDTPGRRRSVLRVLRNWNAFSNSSPVEGLEEALRSYGRRGDKVAVYIFGDDYTGSSYDEVIDTLRELNVDPITGESRVRVHAVGFVSAASTPRYATLMREVTRDNDGTFLALPVRDASGNPGTANPANRDGASRR